MSVKFIEQISHRIRSLPEVVQWRRKFQVPFVVWDQPGIKQVRVVQYPRQHNILPKCYLPRISAVNFTPFRSARICSSAHTRLSLAIMQKRGSKKPNYDRSRPQPRLIVEM